jgi:hypothetical protein
MGQDVHATFSPQIFSLRRNLLMCTIHRLHIGLHTIIYGKNLEIRIFYSDIKKVKGAGIAYSV